MPVVDYLKLVISPMIKIKEDLVIVESQDPMGTLLTVTVNKSDMGLLIGKEGETAKAIRTLVRIAGFTEGARVSVKFAEPVKDWLGLQII